MSEHLESFEHETWRQRRRVCFWSRDDQLWFCEGLHLLASSDIKVAYANITQLGIPAAKQE